MHEGMWRLALFLLLCAPLGAAAEQEVYLDPALRGIEIYRPRGQYPQEPMLGAYEVDLIHKEADAVPKAIHDRFRPRWDIWKATWGAGAPPLTGDDYELLAGMGRPILPLIVDRLLLEDNAPGVALYDRVAPLEWFVLTNPDDPAPPPVALRMKVLRTIRRWLELSPKETYVRND